MKILIIGLGSIGKKHLSAIRSICPDATTYALRTNINAEKFEGVTNIFSLREIEDSIIDFVIISNPTSEHFRTVSKLVEYSIPLFIEKPLSSTLDGGELLAKIVNKDIFNYVACNLRFLECIGFIKEHLKRLPKKRLNEVNVYCGSYLPDWRPNADFRKTYSALPEFGGGVHLDLIHELDYLYWFFGMPQDVRKVLKNKSSLGILAHDFANYVLDYDEFCVTVVLNYYRRDPKRTLELIFQDETWFVDLIRNQVSIDDRIVFTSEKRIRDTYKAQMEYFIANIGTKKQSINTVDDAFNVLKICLGYDPK